MNDVPFMGIEDKEILSIVLICLVIFIVSMIISKIKSAINKECLAQTNSIPNNSNNDRSVNR